MGDRAQREAWVTLATNDTYALGCLVLANSLRRVGTTRQLVVMITEGVSQGMRCQLENVFNSVVDVSIMDSEDERNLALLGRPDLNVTFTKIHCWELTQYEKGIFLDADTLLLQNCDELFDREELSAAPDAGWPDCFNSGVFVFRPSLETYQSILDFALSRGSFDGGDQGLLNSYFNTWSTKDIAKHLPFLYNVVSQAFYSYLPAFEKFRSEIKIVHFIGAIKPWNHPYNTATRTVSVFPETGHWQEFLQLWWNIFMEFVQPCLDPTLTPFIHYEYVLPSSSHPPPQSCAHGMNEQPHEEVDHQPSSYQVLYPYVPPTLDQDFYTPPHPQPAWASQEAPHQQSSSPECQQEEESSHQPPCEMPPQAETVHHDSPEVPQVVDMPIVARSFHPYETHYVEESLLLINPDFPSPVLYESSELEQVLAKEAEKLKCEEEEGELVISVDVEEGVESSKDAMENAEGIVNGARDHSEKSKTSLENCSGDAGTADGARKADGAKSKQEKDADTNELKEKGSAGGLVGELAQMKVGDGDRADSVILDDRERRLAWERGHADYLGVDRFDNIQKKLDEKMAPVPVNNREGSAKKSEVSHQSQSETSLTKPVEPLKRPRHPFSNRRNSENSYVQRGKKQGKPRSLSVGSRTIGADMLKLYNKEQERPTNIQSYEGGTRPTDQVENDSNSEEEWIEDENIKDLLINTKSN